MSTTNKISHEIYEPTDENTVQCTFFCLSLDSNKSSWDHICKKINNGIESLSEEYMWHRDEFKVFIPVNEQNREDPPHLTSITSYGDNIEDEWFIVYIIMELTKQYKDLIVQIRDSDGDFLLIEAADHLPQWANPVTTENRLFIYNNHVHLIPPHIVSLDETLTLKEAIKVILQSPEQTQVSADIEQAIMNRVGNYPDKVKENSHIALVDVPVGIAALLKLKPNFVAPIVERYCHHDINDAKACRNVSYDSWVTVAVKMTKCLYAMLLHSKLKNIGIQSIKDNKKRILGMKLTHGFQMIMNKSSDIYSSKEYIKFLHSLKENGYFRNNIEGSEEYKKLLHNAKGFFSAVECPSVSNVANDISQIMTSNEYLMAKELVQNEHVTASNIEEDNDDWLTIHPEQLNDLLNSRYGKKTKFNKGDVLTPHNITNELNDFLKQTSDFEGIETIYNDLSDNKIDFDSDQFVDCIEKMLKLVSSSNDEVEMNSIESDFSDEGVSQSEDDDEIDKEIKQKLHGAADNVNDNNSILENIIKSMKEEKASVGPSSTLMSSMGLNKTDFLDSDDD